MGAPQLSVVLPVYNEERVLSSTLRAIVAFLEAERLDFELCCVDDGSRDGSLAVLTEAARRDARIRVERLPANRGKGAAVRTGMLVARGERAVFMDADLSTPLDELPRFLRALDSGYEVVIGNRHAPGSRILRRQPRLRELLGKGFTALTRLLLAPGVHDFTCGFKGFQRQAAQAIFSRSLLDGWAFDAELVVIAQELGFKLAQVPVSWAHEEGTKVRVGRAVLGSLRELLVIRGNRAAGRYR
jgi:dolichyl-phosphate beta-glucosyltransferase